MNNHTQVLKVSEDTLNLIQSKAQGSVFEDAKPLGNGKYEIVVSGDTYDAMCDKLPALGEDDEGFSDDYLVRNALGAIQ